MIIQFSRICTRSLKNLDKVIKMSVSSSATPRHRVYVTQPIPNEALKVLQDASLDVVVNPTTPLSRDTLLNEVKNVDALFCTLNERINNELLDTAGEKLKVVATCSVGTDHIDIPECYRRNVRVGYTPGVLTDATAEYTVALLLTTTRHIPEGMIAAKTGEWSTWKIMWMCGKGLKGSTVGIFGMGRIGLAIAKRLEAFEVKQIVYNNRSQSAEATEKSYQFVSFDEMLAKSDFVICCAAATEQTAKVFNKTAFSKMKSDAIFVNMSRGTLVDQDDLYDALNNNTISYAALDVTTPEPLPLDHKLFTLKNCLITPHICSAEKQTRTNMALITAHNIINALNNAPLVSEVSKP